MLGFENTKLILPKERRPQLYCLQIACNYFSEYKLLRTINELKKILNLEVFLLNIKIPISKYSDYTRQACGFIINGFVVVFTSTSYIFCILNFCLDTQK